MVDAAAAADAGSARRVEPTNGGGAVVAEATGTQPRSRFFPKHISPGLLSEKVRARLEESARARAIEAAANDTAPAAEPSFAHPAEPARDAIERADPPANGALRRMVSFENDDGVTVLSNRPMDLPAAPPARPAPSERATEEPAATEAAQGEITQARRLRPKPPEPRAMPAPEPRSTWPWVALGGTAFAGLGVWWVRRGRAIPSGDRR